PHHMPPSFPTRRSSDLLRSLISLGRSLFPACFVFGLLPLPVLVHPEIAPSSGPFLVLLHQEGAEQPQRRRHIGEDPDHSLTPANLPVEALKPVGTAQPAAVALRERHYSHRILKTGFKTGHRFGRSRAILREDIVQ